MNRKPLGVGEWYHCYTRGVDKRRTFQTQSDYRRFIQVLYLANSSEVIHRSNLHDAHDAVFSRRRGDQLTAVAAYCIMPNHFHLVLKETREGGIAKYMQKIGTSYAMYFNIKYERIGNLFVRPFRSKHIAEDRYLRHVCQYIHLNPAELFDSGWKSGRVRNITALERHLSEYPFSSLMDYSGSTRPETNLLDAAARETIREEAPPFKEVVADAFEYYRNLTI